VFTVALPPHDERLRPDARRQTLIGLLGLASARIASNRASSDCQLYVAEGERGSGVMLPERGRTAAAWSQAVDEVRAGLKNSPRALDRLLRHAHVIITDGQESYRLAQATAGKGVKPLTRETILPPAGEKRWPRVGRVDGHQWGETDGH
jgi:hypothetical protein